MAESMMIRKKFKTEVILASIYLAITGIINVIALFWMLIAIMFSVCNIVSACVIITYTACTVKYTLYMIKIIKYQVHNDSSIEYLQRKLASRNDFKVFLILKGILIAITIVLFASDNTLIYVVFPTLSYVVITIISNYYTKLNIDYLAKLIDNHKKLLEGEK